MEKISNYKELYYDYNYLDGINNYGEYVFYCDKLKAIDSSVSNYNLKIIVLKRFIKYMAVIDPNSYYIQINIFSSILKYLETKDYSHIAKSWVIISESDLEHFKIIK